MEYSMALNLGSRKVKVVHGKAQVCLPSGKPNPHPTPARFPSGLTEGAELKLILEMETMLTTRVMEAVTEVGESPL